MRIVVLLDPGSSLLGPDLAWSEALSLIGEAWSSVVSDDDVQVFPVGRGGPRSADALAGSRVEVAGAVAVTVGQEIVLAPAGQAARWEPTALAAALRGVRGEGRTVIVPLGDTPPAGDAVDLWGGDLAGMRAEFDGTGLVALISSHRPLLGFHGMSAAVRDGREQDAALAVAAQQQEERWSAVARDADAVAGERSLVGPTRLSDQPGAGAAGGLAYCAAAVGARLAPGADYLARLTGAHAASAHADLIVAIGDPLTPRSLDEGTVPAASALAARTGVPCVVVTHDVGVGRRDLMAAGIASAHESEPGAVGLDQAVRRVAQTWSPRR